MYLQNIFIKLCIWKRPDTHLSIFYYFVLLTYFPVLYLSGSVHNRKRCYLLSHLSVDFSQASAQITGVGLGRKKGDSANWLHPLPYKERKGTARTLGGSVLGLHASTVGGTVLLPDGGTKIPHALWQK